MASHIDKYFRAEPGESPGGRSSDRASLSILQRFPQEIRLHITTYLFSRETASLAMTSRAMLRVFTPLLYTLEAQSSNFVLGWACYKGLDDMVCDFRSFPILFSSC